MRAGGGRQCGCGRICSRCAARAEYNVVLARNADEALAELERDAARFHVVFSDVVMPGTNGLDLARTIRSRLPDLPIILTSGYSELLARDPGHGFTLLRKPTH